MLTGSKTRPVASTPRTSPRASRDRHGASSLAAPAAKSSTTTGAAVYVLAWVREHAASTLTARARSARKRGREESAQRPSSQSGKVAGLRKSASWPKKAGRLSEAECDPPYPA